MGSGKDSDSYVSPVIKYLVFFFNLIFWLVGAALVAIGAWAFVEKNKFEYDHDQDGDNLDLYDIVFDLTILMMVLGSIIFVLSFSGCVGAIRENIFLLKFFSYFLGFLFIVEVVLAVLAFVFSAEVKDKVTELFEEEGLVRYRDDDDFRNLIDWTQKTFKCCGVGLKGYQDWSNNAYFNCTIENRSAERCGVPYSCCRRPDNIEKSLINTMCGFKTQELSIIEAGKVIYTDGCVQSILDIAEENLYILGGVAIGLAVPQILGVALACILVRDIQLEKDWAGTRISMDPNMRF